MTYRGGYNIKGVKVMRTSGDDIQQVHGRAIVRNGFDYDMQVWVIDWIIQDSNSARAQGLSGCDIRRQYGTAKNL